MNFNRANKPIPEKEISFNLPQTKKFSLNNGLKVFLVEKKELPIVRFNLIVKGGSKTDPQNQKGLANLFSMTLDEGAGDYNSVELSDEFDLLGTVFNLKASQDNFQMVMQTLKDNFDRSLELFFSVVTKPHLESKDFEREQRKVLTKILQRKDHPDAVADNVFEYIVFGRNNPYAFPTLGLKDDVEKLTNDLIKNYYREYFSPNESVLIVVGNITQSELNEKLNLHIAGWNSSVNKNFQINNTKNNKGRIFLVNKENAPQSEIRVGHLSSTMEYKNYHPKQILNSILGGQFSSRINLNLREKKGYTYGAYTAFNYYTDGAYFYTSTSVNTENTVNAVNEILFELNNITKGVTKEELEFAKSFMIRKFPSSFETYGQIASNISRQIIYSMPDEYFEKYISDIEKVSLDDVNAAAVKNILPEEVTVLIIGNKDVLKDESKKLNLGDIVELDENGNEI